MKKDARKDLKRRVAELEARAAELALLKKATAELSGRIEEIEAAAEGFKAELEALEKRIAEGADETASAGNAAAEAVEDGPLVCSMTVKVSAAGKKAFEEAASAAGDTVPEAMRAALAAYIAAANCG